MVDVIENSSALLINGVNIENALLNSSAPSFNSTPPPDEVVERVFLYQMRMVKLVVLIVVVTIMIVSTCRLVFKTQSKFAPVRNEDHG